MKPLISIIVPTYNHELFIERTILSVLDQSYTRWELIIIDDYSNDNTVRIIKRYKQDRRIKLIIHDRNWGIKRLKDTYNQALKLCRGELIAVLEGDDYWPRNKLAIQIKHIKSNDILSFGDWVMVDRMDRPVCLYDYSSFDLNKLNNNPIGSFLYLIYSLKLSLASSTIIIRKTALSEIGGFQSDSVYPFVDIPTYINIALQGRFVYVNELLGFHRKHSFSSWFAFAKNTEDMGRSAISVCFNNFYHKNIDSCKKNKLVFNSLKLQKEKNFFLAYKQKKKPITIFYHYLVFNDINNAVLIIQKLFKIRHHHKIQLHILLIIVHIIILFRTSFLYLIFGFQIIVYRIKKLSR